MNSPAAWHGGRSGYNVAYFTLTGLKTTAGTACMKHMCIVNYTQTLAA